ncbi:MAG: hypothetical protein M0Z55_09980, partial [Peptococcaceae bacterium]|nr:hypothetical protein [Peptococcaceae bacterium]
MVWKKWLAGTALILLCMLVPKVTVLADSNVNLDELTRQRLVAAQTINQACLKCHGQKQAITGDLPGQAGYVDSAKYKASMHGNIACTSCHPNIKANVKHSAPSDRELAKQVDKSCQQCHSDIAKVYANSSHGKLFLEGKETALCSDCHGSHNILKQSDPESSVYPLNSVQTCTKCHDHKFQETYAESFHGRAVSLGSLTAATCVSCHGSHAILGADDP